MYVYKITNIINSKTYIGITKNCETRWRLHKQTSTNEAHPEYEKVLYRAFRKYGIDNFTFEVLLFDLSVEEAKQQEILLIISNDSLSSANGYNVPPGGDLPNGNHLKGEEHPRATISEVQALDIITRRDSGELQKNVYEDYKDTMVFSGGFQSIWLGQSWKHLQPEVIEKRHGRRHLTDEQVREIRTLSYSQSGRSLAKQYEVPTSTISNIINYKTYKNVT